MAAAARRFIFSELEEWWKTGYFAIHLAHHSLARSSRTLNTTDRSPPNAPTHAMAVTDAKIMVNVRLLPEETSAHPHLTRFQRGKRGEVNGPTLRLTCSPLDTVATLKKLILGASRPRLNAS